MSARSCGCPDTPHRHGCRNRYDAGCRCDQCKAGVRELRREYRRPDRMSRTPEQLEKLRNLDEEIAFFKSFHMTDERIAARVGLTVDAIQARRRR